MEPRTYSQRRRQGGYSEPPDESGKVMAALIAPSVLVFVAWHALGDAGVEFMSKHFVVSLEAVSNLRIWTLVTSAFSHVDATHLLFNMIALYVFGRPVAMTLGTRGILHLYFAGALLASLGHVVFGLITGEPNPALGASGAVMAIAVVYAALYPKATLLINFFIPIPAALAVALYIALDLLGVIGMGVGRSNIAHAAHLGGALYGLGYYFVSVRPRLVRRPR